MSNLNTEIDVKYFKGFPELLQFALDTVHVNALVSLEKRPTMDKYSKRIRELQTALDIDFLDLFSHWSL